MRVCVTGSTGFVGRGVVRYLLNAGYDVNAITRKQAENNVDGKLRYFSGQVLSADDLIRTMAGCDALVHLVGARRKDLQRTGLSYDDVDVKSVDVAVGVMQRLEMRRIVLLSAGAIGKSVYVQSKAKAERVVQEAKLDWTILRPAFIVGPGQQWPVIMSPILRVMSQLPGRIGEVAKLSQNVTRDELAQAIVHSLNEPASIGKIFDVPSILQLIRAGK